MAKKTKREYAIEDYAIYLHEAVDRRLTAANRSIARREANRVKKEFNITPKEYGDFMTNLKKSGKGIRSLWKG